jgi:hypothetical protein
MAMDVTPSTQPKVYASNPRPRLERGPTTRKLVSALSALAIVVGLLATPASASTKASPTASTVVNDLAAAGLPVRLTITYTASNDPNELLGRPNEYTSKASFADKRVPPSYPAKDGDCMSPPSAICFNGVAYGGEVEVFPTADLALARYQYLRSFHPFLDEYEFVFGDAVLRLSGGLTRSQANSYKGLFDAIEAGVGSPTPGLNDTIVIPALPGAYGSYSITLLQVYNDLSYYPVASSHPVVVRLRVSDTGSTSVNEDPQADSNILLLGHDYPTWAVVVYNQTGTQGPIWQLETAFLHNTSNDDIGSSYLGDPGLADCPTAPYNSNPYYNVSNVRTFSGVDLIPGSAAETCVAFSLPIKRDRTTLKVCWTPDAAVQLQQPTYCWTFDNDELGAV